MQSVITDTDLMINVLNNLPIEYETLDEKLETEIEARVGPLTLEGLREQLRSKYQHLQKTTGGKTEVETALAARFTKRFKGQCQSCGMFGHKAMDYKTRGTDKKDVTGAEFKGTQKKFQGKCNHCGIFGHMEKNCYKKIKFLKEQSASNSKSVDGMVKASTAIIDVVMMTAGTKSNEIENIWLGDTGSSTHMTN
jgi:hypothetical protein